MDPISALDSAIRNLDRRLRNLANQEVKLQDWKAPTLLNSWTNFTSGYNPIGYWKDPWGVVHLRGLIIPGTIGADIFVLPAGYRPQYRQLLTGMSHTGSAYTFGRVDVATNGGVSVPVSGAGWMSLDGMTFRAFS